MTADIELLPCPFCDSPAEVDSCQHFRAMHSGLVEESAAIYCTRCAAQMTHCYSDHPGTGREQLFADLTEKWNARANVAHHVAAKDAEIVELQERAERLVEALRYAVEEVPELATVPGIDALLSDQGEAGSA